MRFLPSAALLLFTSVIGALGQAPNTGPAPEPAPPTPPDSAKAAIDQATAAVLSDKTKPEDIDAILTKLEDATTDTRSNHGPDYQRTYQQLQAAQQFMKQWQTYLMDKANGNGRSQNDLQNLANVERGFSPIPRSKLLERAMNETNTVANSPEVPLDSLDDVPVALQKLEAMQRGGGYTQELGNLQNALQNLNQAYQQFLEKNYTQALQMLSNTYPMMQFGPRSSGSTSPGAREKIAALKEKLEMKIFAAVLDLPNEPTLRAGQSAQDFIADMANKRAKASDWKGLQQVLEINQQSFGYQPQSWLADDLGGIRALLLGDKLEAAGQHLDAIRSYRQSLNTLGKYFPAAPAQEKLDAMAKKYPDEYKQALQGPIGPRTL